MTSYTVIDSQPTVYQDEKRQVVNGVLVRFRMNAYDEVHEVRVPSLIKALVKAAIEKMVTERDELVSLGSSEE